MSLRNYIVKRLLLFVPTFLGVITLNFAVIQLAPGGPVENFMARTKFSSGEGSGGGSSSGAGDSGRASQGGGESSKAVIEELKKKYGFDKPLHVRYWIWLKSVATLDFGYSHTFGQPVMDVIKSKFPVSIRFGVVSFLISYLVCIPLGVAKAMKDGSKFDVSSSLAIFFLYSIPSFMLAILLIVFFAGGRYFDWFPMGGMTSLDSETWSSWARFKDQVWHMVLPLICFTIGSFTTLTLLMKNSIIEEVRKDYIRTARAKGNTEFTVLFKHAMRNALIPIATGIGGIFGVFFASNLLLEKIFNLDGFGKLFYDAALQRDYPVLMAQVVIGAGLGLTGQIISDLTYVLVDPRINYS
jgi:microcin C transport system permease protein